MNMLVVGRQYQVGITVLVAALACAGTVRGQATPATGVTFSTVTSGAYATGDINSIAISRNNLVTYGNYQYATYYGTDRYIYVARRTTSGATPSAWQARRLDDTVFQIPSSGGTGITDDHNVIAMAIDGDGFMHMSWGMHNVPINIARSANPVNAGWNTNTVNFTKLASMTGSNESSVTYPEFYRVPASGDLLFFYRDGGTGGGSGNGNEYINRYSAATDTWSQISSPFLRGIDPANPTAASGYNGYLNSLAYDTKGTLHATWTWREDPNFQTNHDILYAKSANNGLTWTKQDGTPYGGPITKANAQIVKAIGQNHSLINQSSMTVDRNDRPLLATWYAPEHASGDDTRQYMLEYFDGTAWQTSQITDRATEPLTSNTAADIRETGRPLVLVDKDNRVIVIMRDVQANNNGITAAVSTDRVNWEFLTLSTQNMGQYEPSFDPVLWETKNVLNLFYQPTALGSSSAPVQILQWDAGAHFANVPEPATLSLAGVALTALLRRRRTNA
jgi:hypothetical protein